MFVLKVQGESLHGARIVASCRTSSKPTYGRATEGSLRSTSTTFSAIPFLVNIAGVEAYQHRARTRAGDGDLFATVTPPTEDYEEYCRKILGLGRPGLVLADPVGEPIEVARACSSGSAYERIAAWARDAGEVLLHPYMSIDPVWELAARLARDTQASVRVIGPPAARDLDRERQEALHRARSECPRSRVDRTDVVCGLSRGHCPQPLAARLRPPKGWSQA